MILMADNIYPQNAWWNTGGVPTFPTNWKNSYTFGIKNANSIPVKNPQQPTQQQTNNNESLLPELNRVLENSKRDFLTRMNSNNARDYWRENGTAPPIVGTPTELNYSPSNEEILNDYDAWLAKGNTGNTWQMKLANGVTLDQQNIHNILSQNGNKYLYEKPEGVPDYVPVEVENHNNLVKLRPNFTEAQLQKTMNTHPKTNYTLMDWTKIFANRNPKIYF